MRIVHGTIFARALGAEVVGLTSGGPCEAAFARSNGESREIALP